METTKGGIVREIKYFPFINEVKISKIKHRHVKNGFIVLDYDSFEDAFVENRCYLITQDGKEIELKYTAFYGSARAIKNILADTKEYIVDKTISGILL
jgi:hypothetical protein